MASEIKIKATYLGTLTVIALNFVYTIIFLTTQAENVKNLKERIRKIENVQEQRQGNSYQLDYLREKIAKMEAAIESLHRPR